MGFKQFHHHIYSIFGISILFMVSIVIVIITIVINGNYKGND